MDKVKELVIKAIDDQSTLLNEISQDIWNNPEVAFNELKAHKLLTSVFKNLGFTVEESYCLPTAFRAEYSNGKEGPTVGVICEYDALPGIGHGCGHNLISESGLGAAIGIKAALEKGGVNGKVVCYGTPAEEKGGGKVFMIEKGAFKEVDICLMAHPAPINQYYPIFLSRESLRIQYKGRASHASASPWDGINALDAVVVAYNNISMLRQQMKPSWRVHGIIDNGGQAANVIPAEAELLYMIRTPNLKDQKILREKVENCFKAAATATGCEVTIQEAGKRYDCVLTNETLMELYRKFSNDLEQVTFKDDAEQEKMNGSIDLTSGSTDMGNVSQIVPSIHPLFGIATSVSLHTIDFAKAAHTENAEIFTKITAKSLALTALEVLMNPKLLDEVKEEFKRQKESV